MRQLLPSYAESLDQAGLAAAYAYPAEKPWVRANMVTSLDGSAVQDGRSGGLSSPADQRLFGLLRALADVVLVGAGTVRAEGYRAPRPKPEYTALRDSLGLRPTPVLAVVSARLDLDPESALFGGPEPTVVATCERSDPSDRRRIAAVADLVVTEGDTVDLPYALEHLSGRGLTRVLTEGGPTLLGSLLAARSVDELCLSVSPRAVGGQGPRIVNGPGTEQPFDLVSLAEHDGMLFARYRRSA